MSQDIGNMELLGRLLLAAVAGFILGLPYRKRPGGIRTHLLVTLGAALFCSTALGLVAEKRDVLRIIQGIASGIGFVGAASVLKKGTAIYGITTAASIWIAAAVGCEAMLGSSWLTPVLALFIVFVSELAALMERKVFHRRHRMKPPSLPGEERPPGGPGQRR